MGVHRDQHAVQSDGLDGMNLRAFRRFHVPDDLLVRRDLARTELAAEDDVAVGQHRRVAKF